MTFCVGSCGPRKMNPNDVPTSMKKWPVEAGLVQLSADFKKEEARIYHAVVPPSMLYGCKTRHTAGMPGSWSSSKRDAPETLSDGKCKDRMRSCSEMEKVMCDVCFGKTPQRTALPGVLRWHPIKSDTKSSRSQTQGSWANAAPPVRAAAAQSEAWTEQTSLLTVTTNQSSVLFWLQFRHKGAASGCNPLVRNIML